MTTRLSVPEITNRIANALTRDEKIKEQENIEHPRQVDRMSASGRCYRERWFTFRGFEMDERGGFASNPKLLRIFRLGHVIEDEVVQLLEDTGFTVKDQQLELGSGQWLGHIDGLIDMSRDAVPDWCLLEIKSANAARFELLCELGSYAAWNAGYADQIQAYLHHLNGISDAIIVVYNKNTSELYTERILYDIDAAQLLEKNNALVIAEGNVPPQRPPEAKTQYGQFCKWCDFQQTCWGGAVDVGFDD